MTREWPPDVYGGAGVHVEFLAQLSTLPAPSGFAPLASDGAWTVYGRARPPPMAELFRAVLVVPGPRTPR